MTKNDARIKAKNFMCGLMKTQEIDQCTFKELYNTFIVQWSKKSCVGYSNKTFEFSRIKAPEYGTKCVVWDKGNCFKRERISSGELNGNDQLIVTDHTVWDYWQVIRYVNCEFNNVEKSGDE